MLNTIERHIPDRRSKPRGGRRPADLDGVAPLVMVVGQHDGPGDPAAVVLAKLKFAVAPVRDADDALRVLVSMRPDLVIARESDAGRIRRESPEAIPVLVVSDQMRDDPEVLLEGIRKQLRALGPR